jgi:predicted alpha-1,2-mannosidase
MKQRLILLILILQLFSRVATAQEDYTRYVDPFIGSGGHGHVFVGANVPFGAVQLGPVNIFEGWDWCSGYNYSSNTIVGFTHTHLSGTGIGDLSDVLVMPGTGKVFTDKGSKADHSNGYLSTFSHKQEESSPGYYRVLLEKFGINAELTASERVGFHRYTFPSNADNPHVMLDLSEGIGWDSPVDTYIRLQDDTTLVGYRFSKGWADDQREFFAVRVSQPISSILLFDGDSPLTGTEARVKRVKAVLLFNKIVNDQLKLKVGLSPVSFENALLNMATEIPGWAFDKVKKDAERKWNKELSKISLQASEETKKIFYTGLFHTMIAPSYFNDVNGDYRGTDKKVYPKAGFTNYTTFSLWDTYRAYHPLYTILHPERVTDIVRSMLAIYEQQGKLPVWHLKGNETNTMVGYHAVPVIADAYRKGFAGFDVTRAYEAVRHSAMQKTDGIDYAQRLSFIPGDSVKEAVAKGLEYAIDDWCIAQMAKSLGKKDDYDYFLRRSRLYREYFDPKTKFMRGRLDANKWRTPFDPVASKHRDDDYAEGNAWQYTWLVPHDPAGLIKLFGGRDNFVRRLDSLFVVEADLGAESSPDISGLIGQYAHGNEPGHHTTYLYAWAGQPWKTAELVRRITKEFYTTKPDGLCGNEDVGQMSAWYVLSALGFYPVNPANGIYIFGSPVVNAATITVGERKFQVEVIDNSESNKYIQKMTLNGKPYTKSYLRHEDIAGGGVLRIWMGVKPSDVWGTGKKDIPE